MSRELNTLAAAYALDAVSDDERAVLESHLPEMPELEREINDLRLAAALLAEPVAMTPPVRVREAVLQQISGIRQLPPIVAGVHARPAGVSNLGEHRARRAARLSGWRRSLAVGAVAAAVAAGAVVVAYQSFSPSSSSPTAVEDRADAQSTSVAVAGSGHAVVSWSDSGRAALVRLNSLASAPVGRTYQLWLISPGGVAVSKGTFSPVGTSTQLGVDGVVPGDTVGVTIEPAGGSKRPTTTPIVAVRLT